MSDETKVAVNMKVVLYFLTIIPPVVQAVLGAYNAIRDAIKKLKGEKTRTQIALEEYAKKLVGEALAGMMMEEQKRFNEDEMKIIKEMESKKNANI